MAAPRESLNKATHSVGFHAKFVTVTAITADSLWAITTDRQYIETRVPLLVQRSKAPLPEVGDTWLIDQAMGSWTFAAFVGKSTADFAGKTVAMDVADLIYVQSSPPSSPRLGDMWMNSSRGNELSQWQGSGWAALQFGTDAIANKSITAAKLADKTVTAQQISDAAGITSSQVAFTVHDIGGSKVFTGTSQPAGMQPGDIWLNPAAGNAMATWTGAVWHPLQFGALAIAPASITGAQISGSAGIGANQINFTARDIGGITTSISAAQPAHPVIGDLWYDATNGYVLDQWNGTAWVPFQYGTNAIQAGSITAALIAANTITAAQIAAGTITAAQIAAGTITASLFAAVGTQDYNAYLAGGDSTGWTTSGGTFSVLQPAGAPYTNVAQISCNGSAVTPKILAAVGGVGMIPVQVGQQVLISALVYTAQTTVVIGAVYYDVTNTLVSNDVNSVTVTANTWTYVYYISTVPATAVALSRAVGLTGTPVAGTLLQATAITALSGFDGGVITAGTITAAQIAAGSIVAGLIDANAIDGMTITGNTINGATINAGQMLVTGSSGGLFVYENSANQTVQVFNTTAGAGTWTCPAGVTSVFVELWGGGGGGSYGGGGTGNGGGAGAYAASTITVVPGTVYSFFLGNHGNGGTSGSQNGTNGTDTTWQSTVIVAKAGKGATTSAVGTHQTGSVGTTVFQGGDGFLGYMAGSNFLGGGGGGSGGTAANGKNATGTSGATAVSGGGPGGNGANANLLGAATAPNAKPGGGGGGGASGVPNGAAGKIGQVRLTFSAATTILSGSIAGQSGTDPVAGIAYPEGAQFDNIRDSGHGGNRVSAQQNDNNNSATITATGYNTATNLWSIPANDAAVDTCYRVRTFGHGTWGSTQEQLQFDLGIDGAGFTGGQALDATTFNASEAFNFEFVAEIYISTAGVSGLVSYFLKFVASSNSHLTQNGYTVVRRGGGVALNTTVAHTMELMLGWLSATGAPTITTQYSTFERKGP